MSSIFHFVLVPFLIFDLLIWWLMDRLVRQRNLGLAYRIVWAVWVLLMAASELYLFTTPIVFGEWSLTVMFYSSVYLWHIAVVPVLLLWALARQAWQWVNEGARRILGQKQAIERHPTLSRRRFLHGLMLSPIGVTIFGAAVACWQLRHFRIRRLELKFPQLPPELDGFTITHLSDLHVGVFTTNTVLPRLIEATNALESDLVVMTGDLINFSIESLPLGIEIMKQIKSRYGLYLCEGNHDLIPGIWKFRNGVKAAGLNLLVDEAVTIRHQGKVIRLIGTHWTGAMNGSKDKGFEAEVFIDLIRRGIEPLREIGAFNIVLSHHPHSWDSALGANIDLTLSGHTHGGQIMLDDRRGFGPWLFRYWSGLYQKGHQSLVVSNGVGAWFPLRIHAPAEIIHLTLRSV